MFVFNLLFITLCPFYAIILKRKRKLVALLLFSYRCLDPVNVLWLMCSLWCHGLVCSVCLLLLPFVRGFVFDRCLCPFSFAIILIWKRELVILL